MTKVDLDEYGIDPDGCSLCPNDKTFTDRCGYPWCDEHKHRGQLLNWGLSHNFPDLPCHPYAIGPSEFCWNVAVTAGRDELIWFALAYIEHRENNASTLSNRVAVPLMFSLPNLHIITTRYTTISMITL